MSHRTLVLAIVIASGAAACAAPTTAPSPRTLAPHDAARHVDPGLCRSGWVNSEGRCI